MKPEKRQGYDLLASVHTTQIETMNEYDDAPEYIKNCVNSRFRKKDGGELLILNLNRLVGDLFSYHDFTVAFDTVVSEIGIEEYAIKRIDMRFDSYDSDHYREYQKLNRYLISMLACAYETKNNYKTDGLFSQRQISVAIKSDDFEIENYDREVKNQNTGNVTEQAKSRLEERSKRKDRSTIWKVKDLEDIFCKTWFRRWDKAYKCMNDVQRRYNEALAKIYYEDKDKKPAVFKSVSEFLRRYQDCIFTKKQLIDLLTRIGVENPETAAKNFKNRSGIEFFSKSDIKYAVDQIKRSTLRYFEKAS